MYENLYERINKASKSNSLTFFVGAGVSALSGAPKWSELIESFCDVLGISKDFSSDDYLKIPQKFYYYIDKNDGEYYNFINECFKSDNKLEPNAIHSILYSMNPANIITTNFDNLLEDAAIQNYCNYKSIACKEDVPQINGDKFILKIHGDLVHQNIVLKEEDYLNYSNNFKLMETLLKSIFSTNTVVFIGYSLNDNNIKLILNWAKALLNESFNTPIFIYTDSKELDETDLLYEESRGLSVIDYHNCNPTSDDYLVRYKCCLEMVLKHNEINTDNYNKIQLFDYVYNCLKPLDELSALRITDITSSLNYKVIVDKSGIITERHNSKYFEYFMEINKDIDKYNKLDKGTQNKYDIILSVLSKANIDTYDSGELPLTKIEGIYYKFADETCLHFDYVKMKKYVSKEYTNLYKNYLKAYYFAKLNKYEDSFSMFKFVCKECLIKNNYVLYYLARINLSQIFQAKRSIGRHLFYSYLYEIEEIDKRIIDNRHYKVFEDMPIEFKVKYTSLESLSSSKQLYLNFYNSFLQNEKLQQTIDGSVIEFGSSSLYNSFSMINENLNFYLGNHIFIDEFEEFKNSIRILMETLLAKYSVQHNYLKEDTTGFSDCVDRVVKLDETDFYCLVDYFKYKDLLNLFNKYNIKSMVFNNVNIIENMVSNLINYYNILDKNDTDYVVQKSSLERKIKTSLVLIRKMNVSSNLINKIVNFLFSNEFSDIDISFKIIFSYIQLKEKEMNNIYTRKLLENTLLKFIEKDIKCIINGKRLDLKAKSDINYWNISNLLLANTKKYKSSKLSVVVNQIIDNQLNELYETLANYYDIIDFKTKKRILKLYADEIQSSPKYYQFEFLFNHSIILKKAQINALKNKIRETISNNGNFVKGVTTYPKTDKYEELVEIAFWCNIGYLNTDDFKEFYGINDKADFFFDATSFDFSKFNIEWLFNLTDYACEKICNSTIAKVELNKIIKDFLQNNQLDINDNKRLTEIYIKYFS